MFTLLFLLALVVAGGAWSESRLLAEADQLQHSLEILETSLLSGDWTAAGEEMKQIATRWGKAQKKWDLAVKNSRMDDLAVSISRLNNAVRIHDRQRALDEVAAIAALIDTIVTQERFTVRNIF